MDSHFVSWVYMDSALHVHVFRFIGLCSYQEHILALGRM